MSEIERVKWGRWVSQIGKGYLAVGNDLTRSSILIDSENALKLKLTVEDEDNLRPVLGEAFPKNVGDGWFEEVTQKQKPLYPEETSADIYTRVCTKLARELKTTPSELARYLMTRMPEYKYKSLKVKPNVLEDKILTLSETLEKYFPGD